MQESQTLRFVLCVENEGYPASLEKRKIYEALPDLDAAENGQIRVKDESGDDYLFPAEYFVAVDLPKAAIDALTEAA